ncbi:hypothetical protein [Haloarcula hispanica]|uniref:hypothetical protein n=1 Tax=Haloarcula hispanica TaxID=51589 RepID=UPI0011B5B8AE|nr:hypothetical protein [Haloarcula hispanica]
MESDSDFEEFTEADEEALKKHQKTLEQSDSCPECGDRIENVPTNFWRPILSCMHPNCRMHISDEEVEFAMQVYENEQENTD